jgi:hypothetical protein
MVCLVLLGVVVEAVEVAALRAEVTDFCPRVLVARQL